MGDHLFQREHTLKAVLIVYHIHRIDVAEVFGLPPHLAKAVGHGKILVHNNHLRAHKAAGRVFVILQKVYDVAGLLNVADMLDYLAAILLVGSPG